MIILHKTWLPFPPITVRPNEMAWVSARPQRPFRGERLAVWSRTAPSFVIESLRVGSEQMGVTSGGCPAEVFASKLELLARCDEWLADNGAWRIELHDLASDAIGQELSMPVAQPGMDVALYVSNIDNEPYRFHAALLGVWVDERADPPKVRRPPAFNR